MPLGWSERDPAAGPDGRAGCLDPGRTVPEVISRRRRSRAAPIEMQVYPGAYHGFDAPNLPRRELPDYRTRAGVVPIIGTDPAARADALPRVPAFLARFLGNWP